MMRLLSILFVAVLLVGCGTSEPTTAPTPDASARSFRVYVPPGVDSSTAQRADSMAQDAFVSLEKQQEARSQVERGDSLVEVSDTLWKYLDLAADTSAADSVNQDRRAEAVGAYNRGAKSLIKYQKVTQAAELDSAKLSQMQADLLKKAETAFEEAIQLNPYDQKTQSLLAQVYKRRANRLGREADYQKAIAIYQKLTRLRKDQPGLYVNLANVYFEIERYDVAATNYGRALDTYLESVELALDSARVDSGRVYNYARAEAEAFRYAREPEPSLRAYRRAKTYATTPAQRRSMQGWVEWINWDDGNIAASFARDSLQQLAGRGDAAAAAEGFRTLKPTLRTASARNEIDWRLAQAEYQLGERQPAADRLQRLVQRLAPPSDTTTRAAADSTTQRYLNTYGTICLNLGRRFRRKNLRTALKYLKQSAAVAWKQRALAELEVGQLLRNNVEASIDYLERAAQRPDELGTKEKMRLYRSLVNQHRRLGHREQAVVYRKRFMALRREAR